MDKSADNPATSSSTASSSEALKASGGERQLPGVSVSSCPDPTPEMISAGIWHLVAYGGGDSMITAEEAVTRIYIAMETAKH